MVTSADSHGPTRPSYFGPDSLQFSSRRLEDSAAWTTTKKPNKAPSPAPKESFRENVRRSRMVGPPDDRTPRPCREGGMRSSATRQHLPTTRSPAFRRSFHGNRGALR